ncbi:MAG: toprim domain-containing protein [Chloroflexi bacterium]|nr:toprim domain-containing protein [Chloroflexota bacterium]MBU1747578.1 toprim domain-containing protein [Chloroflexota bacterium]
MKIDPTAIAQAKEYPLAAVAERQGVALRQRGRTLIGCCPFHDDHTPSLVIWTDTKRFKCFGCGAGGDVIDFVRRAQQCDFRTAVAWLLGTTELSPAPITPAPPRAARSTVLDQGAVRILDVAALAYHHYLLDQPAVLRLLAERGVSAATAQTYHIGYTDGQRLVPALRRRGLSLRRARALGLLNGQGEHLAGRLTFPVPESGRPAFLMGRRVQPLTEPHWPGEEPKYLGLPLPKPLYIGGQPTARLALVVEGPFDLWLLHEWGYGAAYALVALLGTQAKPDHLAVLQRYARLLVCLDHDAAGQLGTTALCEALGPRVQPVALPPDVHDVSELGPHGRDRWAAIAQDGGIVLQ